MGHRACSVFAAPGVLGTSRRWCWGSINLSTWHKVSWAYTPGYSGTAPTGVPFYSVHSAPHKSSTTPEKSPFRCPQCSRHERFTSDSWRLKHINLHDPEHHQVECQKIVTMHSIPHHVEPTQRHESNGTSDSVEKLDICSYLDHLEQISGSESQPPPPPLPQTEIYHGASALLCEYIAEPGEQDAQCCLETDVLNNPYYPFVTREEYKYIQCGIKKRGMKTYYDNVLKEANTALRIPSFRIGDGIKKLVASMPDDQALAHWELHTLEDVRWNDNHQHPIEYWSRDISNRMRWWGGSQRTPSISCMPLSVALTAICHQNATIPKCTLWTGGGRHRYAEMLKDKPVLIDISSTLRVGDTLVPWILMSDGTHLTNFATDKKQ